MVSRRRSPPRHASAPAPERMFEGCRRARSLWGGVRLEVAGESSPVVLHSFTQLDPDLPPLEVSAGRGGWGSGWGGVTAAMSLGVSARCGMGGQRCPPPLCSLGFCASLAAWLQQAWSSGRGGGCGLFAPRSTFVLFNKGGGPPLSFCCVSLCH